MDGRLRASSRLDLLGMASIPVGLPPKSVILEQQIVPLPTSKKSSKRHKATAEYRYGWGRFTPDCFQFFHKPAYLLFCLCMLLLVQGMVVNGILPASVSHLERRFHFSTAEIGTLSSVYDLGFLLVLLPISHYGSDGRKSLWIAGGAMTTGLASIVCVLPHLLAETYQYGEPGVSEQYCHQDAFGNSTTQPGKVYDAITLPIKSSMNTSSDVECKPSKGMIDTKYLFYIGELLFGMGSAPQQTIAIAYLDESVSQSASATFNGIYDAMFIVGPCIGYAVGAYLSRIYGDLDKVDPKGLRMTPDDPRWYGAWWIGVLGAGLACLLLAIPISGFGRELPGSAKLRAQGIDEPTPVTFHVAAAMADWDSFKCKLRVILSNPTYVGLVVETCATTFVVGGFAAFSTKYVGTQFFLTTNFASMLAVATAIPPAIIGIGIGTIVQRKMHLMCNGKIMLSILSTSLATAFWMIFFVTCPVRRFAGVTVLTQNDSPLPVHGKLSLDTCYQDCKCSQARFEPICFENESVSFFSYCHAGCSTPNPITNVSECLCTDGGTAGPGMCDSRCTKVIYAPFLAGLALLVLFVYLKHNPVRQTILRCVPFSVRTLALALGWFTSRLLGSMPSAPLMGWLFNNACLLWQEKCGVQEVCVLYDNDSVAAYLQLTGVIGFAVAYVALVIAWQRYKPPPTGEVTGQSSERSLTGETIRSSWEDPVLEP